MATTQEGESSMERPRINDFLFNSDNKGLMTYISLFKPQFNHIFRENKDVC